MQSKRWHSYARKGMVWAFLIATGINSKAQTASINRIPVTSSTTYYNDIQPLTIDDVLPDIPIKKTINYPGGTISTATFKDKLLILDFLSTGCPSCIAKLPLFDSLQQMYGDRVQFLIVTPQKEEKVKAFLVNTKIGKQLHNLAFVVEDELLKKYFPHEYISHIAWIYKSQVKAITRSEYIKAVNIQAVLNGREVNWPTKIDVTDYDYSQPLMIANENGIPVTSLPAKSYHSTFTSYMPNISKRASYDRKRKIAFETDSVNQTQRFFLINHSIIDMYLKVFGLKASFPSSYIALEVKNKDRFVLDKQNSYVAEWRQNNTYCYEAIFPFGISQENMNKKILNDLNLYLGVNGRLEKRKVKCLVLVQIKGNKQMEFTTTRKSTPPIDKNDKEVLRQIPLSSVLYNLNDLSYGQPIFDNSGYDGKKTFVDLSLNQLASRELIKKELIKYGLILKEETREVELLVISESPQ